MTGLSPEQKNATMAVERAFLTKLLGSALEGDFDTLKQAVEGYCRQHDDQKPQDVLLQCRDGQKRTVLHFACQSTKNEQIVKQLLDQAQAWKMSYNSLQSWIRAKDKDGLTPLMLAAQVTDTSVAESRVLVLLERATAQDTNTNQLSKLGLARSHAGATALHYAASAGATAKSIKAIYEAGPVALSTFSRQGGTPLHWACAHASSNTDTITALLECGADWKANATEPTMVPPPLVLALAAGNVAFGKLLIEHVVNKYNASDDDNDMTDVQSALDYTLPGGTTLLHMAADLDMVSILQKLQELIMLLRKRRNDESIVNSYWNKTNDQNETSIDVAAREGHTASVRYILSLTSDDETSYSEDAAREYIQKAKTKVKPTKTIEKATTNEESKAANSTKENESIEPDTADASGMDSLTPAQLESLAKDHCSRLAQGVDISTDTQEKAQELKNTGNTHFGKKEWQKAAECYTAAIDLNPVVAAYYSNRSACNLHMHKPKLALFDALIARNLEPKWPKGAYRHALALLELKMYEDAAMAAWQGIQQLDEGEDNDELQRLMKKCVKLGRQDYQEQKKKDKTTA